jgi:hypothetical protein
LGNGISDEGAFALAEMLRENSYLFSIYLYLNWIGNEGAIEISKAVSRHPHLSTLWIDHNPISLDGVSQCVNFLLKSSALINLEITSQNEMLANIDYLKIKIMMGCNSDRALQSAESARKLLRTRSKLLVANLPFPVEILQYILFVGSRGLLPAEEAILGSCLLERRVIGALNRFDLFSASALIRECSSIRLE